MLRGGIAIKANGECWTWGLNNVGQCGLNNVDNPQYSPVPVVGAHSFVGIASGEAWCLAIKANGECWSWGEGGGGATGQNGTADSSSPIQVVGSHAFESVYCGRGDSYGLKSNGETWAWGAGSSGELGDGAKAQRNSPVLVIGNHTFTKIAAGNAWVAGLKANGEVWTWGAGSSGQLGNDDAADYSSPVLVVGSHSFVDIGASNFSGCAIKANGELWTWGDNADGTLGNNTLDNTSSPVLAVGSHVFEKVAISGGGISSAWAIKSDGAGWAWGYNAFGGQLGDGTTTERSSPVAVVGAHAFDNIAPGYTHTFGIKSNGEVWAWGDGVNGCLAQGGTDTTDYSSPVMIVGAHTFVAVAQGNYDAPLTGGTWQPTIGAQEAQDVPSNSGQFCMVRISDTLVVTAACDSSGNSNVYVQEYTGGALTSLSEGNDTFGGSTAIDTGIGLSIGGCFLTSPSSGVYRVAFCYADDALDDDGYTIVGDFEYGVGWTWGTAVEFAAVDVEAPKCVTVDSTHYIIAYNDEVDGDQPKACCCSVATRTVTAGTPIDISVTSNRGLGFSLALLDTDKVVCSWSEVQVVYACVISRTTGTTITAGTRATMSTGTDGGNHNSIAVSGTGGGAVTFCFSLYDTDRLWANGFTVSGTTITPGTATAVSSSNKADDVGGESLVYLGNNDYACQASLFDGTTRDSFSMFTFSVNGTTVTAESETQIVNVGVGEGYISAFGFCQAEHVLLDATTSVVMYRETVSNNTVFNVITWAQPSASPSTSSSPSTSPSASTSSSPSSSPSVSSSPSSSISSSPSSSPSSSQSSSPSSSPSVSPSASPSIGNPEAYITGTIVDTIDESDIRAGGKTIIITLNGTTWQPIAGSLFDNQRQYIINGLDSAQGEGNGWNAEVRDKIPVTDVVRTDNNIVTITLTAEAGYDITAQETITVTVPATAVLG